MLRILALFALFVVGVALLGAWLCRYKPCPVIVRLDAGIKRLRRPAVKELRGRLHYALRQNPIRRNGCYDRPWVRGERIG